MLAILIAGPLSPACAQGSDESGLARLAWKTMVTLDDANKTGNYAILHSLSAPEFQQSQSPASLSLLFKSLRENNIDLSRTLTVAPTWYLEPAVDENGYLRLRGAYEFRPKPIRFDMLFRYVNGDWRLLGLSVVEAE